MNKKLLGVVIAFIALTALITADITFDLGLGKRASSFLAPVGVVFSNTGDSIGGFFGGISHIGSLQKENKDLSNKLNSALTEIANLSEAKKENDSLRRDLGFKLSSQLNLVPATIAYFDPSLRDGITVKVDDSSGIKVGAVVVSEGFLIGRVSEVSGNIIHVLLITDSQSAIPGTLQGREITGIASGKIGNGLSMEQVPQSDSVASGELVVTSGLGGDVPKGLILGKVDQVQKIAGSIFQQISLQPMVEFVSLERVMIAR